MAWRIVYLGTPCRLNVKNSQLHIDFEKKNIDIPIEDIAVVIIDTPIATLTAPLLTSFAENNIVLINCDKKHLPIYMCQSLVSNSRQVQIENLQLNMTVPFKKRIWQSIVSQKIYNQGKTLELLGIKGYSKIYKYAKEVTSGDSENTEAISANKYFTLLFGYDFNRRDSNIINVGLNYGYSILRSLMARSLISYGFLLSQGVHHHNELNPYNLVDDFMEPYRPLVDYFVYNYFKNNDYEFEEFPKELKIELLNIVEYMINIDDKNQSIRRSTEIFASSFQTCVKNSDYKDLKVPILKEIKLYDYE